MKITWISDLPKCVACGKPASVKIKYGFFNFSCYCRKHGLEISKNIFKKELKELSKELKE
jgi:hypothetical protein